MGEVEEPLLTQPSPSFCRIEYYLLLARSLHDACSRTLFRATRHQFLLPVRDNLWYPCPGNSCYSKSDPVEPICSCLDDEYSTFFQVLCDQILATDYTPNQHSARNCVPSHRNHLRVLLIFVLIVLQLFWIREG